VAGALAALGKYHWNAADWYFRAEPNVRLQAGEKALREGDLERAGRIADLLESAGNEEHAALLRGESLFQRGDALVRAQRLTEAAPLLLLAVHELERIKSLGPIRVRAVALYGRCSLHLGSPREAEHAFLAVLSQDPDNVEAHRGLAALYFDQGALTQSASHLRQVSEIDVHDSRPHRLLGLIYKDLKQYALAVDAYREALRRGSAGQDQDAVRRELAESLIKQVRFPEALDVINQIDPSEDDRPALEALRAEALLGLGRVDDAKAILDASLKNSTGNADLYRLRGQLELLANQPQNALSNLERAVLLNPDDIGSRYQLVVAYRKLGRKDQAEAQERLLQETQKNLELLAHLNEEAGRSPWDAGLRIKMAETCERVGRFQDAAMWRRAAAACTKAPMR
jgi:tetratricopeptide (TPR) repeat protein